jgi:uncharacterized membrane protein
MKGLKTLSHFLLFLLALTGGLSGIFPLQAADLPQAEPPLKSTDLILNLLPGGYYEGIRAGEESQLFLELRNEGDAAVTNIRFNASLPEGWAVRFDPAVLSILAGKSSTTLDAYITPAKNASGGYNVTLMAQADQTRALTSAYFNIKSGTDLWIWLGIGIGVVVIAGFILVFRRFGRD